MSGPKLKELERFGVLALVASWLLHPFATGRMYGAGDALWYTDVLADFVTQLRAGIFPIFAGQTEYAFNGAVYPLRVAPMYQHLAGLLDLLTGRSLGFIALQHLTVIVCGVAGLYASYWTLCRISPGRRWCAAGFAVLYLSCPGLLATIYTQDLYMTWMTVPLAPLAAYGIVRTFRKDDVTSQLWLATPLAALWWAHSPIALWFTFVAAASQLVRLAGARTSLDPFKRSILGAVIFALLAQYPFVSVAEIQSPGTQSSVVGTLLHADQIPETIRSVWPAAVLPLSEHARELSDLQLGYAFWAVLICSLPVVVAAGHRDLAVLLGSSVFLLILVLPVPGLNPFLWDHMPAEVVRITYYWPMQRFYLIVAALLSAAGQIAFESGMAKGEMRSKVFGAILVTCCLWSLFEARQFLSAASERTRTEAESARVQRPENLLLMNHSYGLFSKLPAFFSNGVVDPRSQARLRSAESGNLLPTPAGKVILSGSLTGTVDANPGILDLSPVIHLERGHRYGLVFHFAQESVSGILQFSGRSLFREYLLPSSGEPQAFGSGAGNSRVVDLWTSAADGDNVEVRFIPAPSGQRPEDITDFASFELRETDSISELVTIESLVPFQARVRTRTTALLETPREFMPGYVAKVDGQPAEARRSDEGLVEVLVPPGDRSIVVAFKAPFILAASYWAAMLVWTAILPIAVFAALRAKN